MVMKLWLKFHFSFCGRGAGSFGCELTYSICFCAGGSGVWVAGALWVTHRLMDAGGKVVFGLLKEALQRLAIYY